VHDRFAFLHAVVHVRDCRERWQRYGSFARIFNACKIEHRWLTSVPSVARERESGFAIQIAEKRHAKFEPVNGESPAPRAPIICKRSLIATITRAESSRGSSYQAAYSMRNLVTGGSGLSRANRGKSVRTSHMKMRRKVHVPTAIVITMAG